MKYHWYQVRLLGKCGPKQLRKHRGILREVGEVLGQAHDLANLEASTSGSVRKRARRDKKRLLRHARGELGRVLKSKPSRLARELRVALERSKER